ncbi:MAG: transcriptional regulator [Planctomycetales bacterium]|nr:transcriptional regulator [Planctomycetales bacterium]
MNDIDRVIHEPVRLRILTVLTGVDLADFNFFLATLGLSRGNLSSHVDKLQRAGYVDVRKSFNGKLPHTDYQITENGRKALADYWQALDQIRAASHDNGSA